MNVCHLSKGDMLMTLSGLFHFANAFIAFHFNKLTASVSVVRVKDDMQ